MISGEDAAERILVKILKECYVDYSLGRKHLLVIDGTINWTPEEDAYLDALWERTNHARSVRQERIRTFGDDDDGDDELGRTQEMYPSSTLDQWWDRIRQHGQARTRAGPHQTRRS